MRTAASVNTLSSGTVPDDVSALDVDRPNPTQSWQRYEHRFVGFFYSFPVHRGVADHNRLISKGEKRLAQRLRAL